MTIFPIMLRFGYQQLQMHQLFALPRTKFASGLHWMVNGTKLAEIFKVGRFSTMKLDPMIQLPFQYMTIET